MVDFVIAGAGKSGTSSLFDWLSKHPQIEGSKIKEPRFFTEVEESNVYPREGTFKKGFEWYHSLFDSTSKYRMEASTIYFTAEDSPAKISEFAPEAKIVFILRNPTDRFYAHYWQEYKTQSINISFEELLNSNHERVERYYRNSAYKTNLKRFFECFPKSSLGVFILEEYAGNNEALFRAVCTFLELDSFQIENLEVKNKSGVPKSKVLAKGIRLIRRVNAMHNSSILKNMTAPLKGMLSRITNMNLEEKKYIPMQPGIRRELDQRFEEDITYVESLLKRPVSVWSKSDQ